jgi:cytochrome c556
MKPFIPVIAACVVAGFAATVLAQADVIAERKALMRANGAAAKTASEMISGAKPYDAAAAAQAARTIAEDMDKFPTLFPEGSDQGDTSAAPAIWEKMDAFKAAAAKAANDARVAETAAAQGLDAFKMAFADVGENCQSCHGEFRIRR